MKRRGKMQNSKENYVEESLDFNNKYHNETCKKQT